jgi:proline iminopeptidase
MRTRSIVIRFATAALVATTLMGLAVPFQAKPRNQTARETRVSVGKTSRYAREIGQGPSIIVLHGGPDFDHAYLLPDLDRLADSFRLIYYVRDRRFGQSQTAFCDGISGIAGTFLGRSSRFGIYHSIPPTSVSLILMNPAPPSAADLAEFRKVYLRKLRADMDCRNYGYCGRLG